MREGIRQGAAALRRRHARGVASALAGALLWGLSGACAQYLFERCDLSPSFVTMVRALVAGVLFVGLLAWRQRATLLCMLRDARTMGSLAVFGLGIFGSQFAFAMSVAATNAGTATVLQMTGTVFIMVFTCAFAKKLPRAAEVAGLLAAVCATWMIATQGDASVLVLPADGLAWGLLNGLAVALYVMWPKRLFARFGSVAATGVAMFVCGLLSTGVWVAQGLLDGGASLALPTLDAAGFAVLVGGVAVAGTFVAFALYLHGVSLVGSVEGGLLGAVEPVSATVFSALWLGTVFTGFDLTGCALMIAMVFLVSLRPRTSGARCGTIGR